MDEPNLQKHTSTDRKIASKLSIDKLYNLSTVQYRLVRQGNAGLTCCDWIVVNMPGDLVCPPIQHEDAEAACKSIAKTHYNSFL